MVRLAHHYHAEAVRLSQPDGVRAADFRDPLADAVLPIVSEARSAFGHDAAIGPDIDVSHQDQVEIERQ
jgi:hypothetical protein